MPDKQVLEASETLERAYAQFQRDNPKVAEALEAMNMSFTEYLEALAAMKEPSTLSGNATTID